MGHVKLSMWRRNGKWNNQPTPASKKKHPKVKRTTGYQASLAWLGDTNINKSNWDGSHIEDSRACSNQHKFSFKITISSETTPSEAYNYIQHFFLLYYYSLKCLFFFSFIVPWRHRISITLYIFMWPCLHYLNRICRFLLQRTMYSAAY